MHNNQSINTCCSCVPGVRYALQAVKECICLFKDDPTLSVVIKITKISGSMDTITLRYSTLNLLKICSDVIVYDSSLVIPIEDISKVQVLTSAVTNQGFKNCIKAKLSNPNPAEMALSMDNNPRGGSSNKNCPPKPANNCNAGLSCFINEHRDDLSHIQFEGSGTEIEVIKEVDMITPAKVVSDVILETTTKSVASNLKLTTESTNVINTVVSEPVKVITSAQSTEHTVVKNVTSRTANALIEQSSTQVDVVSKVNTDPQFDVVTGVTLNTQPVCAPLVTQDLNVLTSLALTAIPKVATNLSTTTGQFVTGLGTPSTDTCITGYPNITTVQVLSPGNANPNVVTDLTSITPVEPTAIDVPTIASANNGVGTLQVIVPANAFGAGVPAAAVTLDVVVGTDNNPVSLAAPRTIHSVDSQDPVLTGQGTPAIRTINAALGNPNLVTVIQSLGTPSTSNCISGYPNLQLAPAVTAVNKTEVTINNPSTPTTLGIKGITTTPTTLDAGTGLTVTKQPILPLKRDNPVTSTKASLLGSPVTAPFVFQVTPITDTIASLDSSTSTTVNSLKSFTDTSVINKATLSSDPVSVVDSASLGVVRQDVVGSITLNDISVTTTAPDTINGVVIGLFGGIMTLEATNGDINIYSLCHIVSASTNLPK